MRNNAINMIMKGREQQERLDFKRDITNHGHDNKLLKIQNELLKIDRKILYAEKELEAQLETEEKYTKVAMNLEDMYFMIKTEGWAHRLNVTIDSFKAQKFCLQISYKDIIECDIYLKAKGKNLSCFKYDLMGITLRKCLSEYEYLIKQYLQQAIKINDYEYFIKRIASVLWRYKRDSTG